ncbi:RloB family protein [Cryptosporangium aurantiacum]|uniref:RloB-like protein n=1 Tax=Cryptosporangium aurantiacum TaxID=134849 RepID=A0A1M7RP58_9ACTN|nr:RloB family protein [Cryptosporangium aurantiacum]SHN47991.1 RloB-like protein [Cryptosporangium aurantiacum]
MTTRSRRPSSSLKRRTGFRRPRKTFVIYCEGRRTEPEYLEELKRDPEVRDAAAVDLRIQSSVKSSTPLALVQLAIEAKDRNTREQGEVDEFWCVFDVEWPQHHPGLIRAVETAQRAGISLAISNPCFEIWLVWHFRDHTSFIDTAGASRLRRACDGQDNKGVSSVHYMPHKHDASRRAKLVEERHRQNDVSFPNDNPSSGMHRLVDAVTSKGT